MREVGGQDLGRDTSMRRVTASSLIGASLEWYDFGLYGWTAALAFNVLFFPNVDPLIGTLVAFASYGAGFFMRPVGSLLFGHFGDKVGRKSMLVITIVIMGLATAAVGFLPTYQAIGIWAPILLVVLRLVQGLAVGGEFGGAALMIVEHAPRDRRGFWGSWAIVGNPAGLLLSIIAVYAFASALPEEQFLAWGWRVPFILSLLLLIVGLYIRLNIEETPAFERMKAERTEVRMPVVDLLRRYPGEIIKAFLTRAVDSTTANVFTVFAVAYITTQLGLPNSVALIGAAIGNGVQIVLFPIGGAISDRVGRRPTIMVGAAIIGLTVFPAFALMETGNPVLIWLAVVLAFPLGTSLVAGPTAALLAELFDTSVRYSGTAFVFQLSAIAGGITPFVATALLAAGGGEPWLVAAYVLALVPLAVAGAYLLPETSRRDTS